MSSSERKLVGRPFYRALFWAMLAAGVAAMLWPAGQIALSWHQQRALRQEWNAQIQAVRVETSKDRPKPSTSPVPTPTTTATQGSEKLVSRSQLAQAKLRPKPAAWQPTRIVIPSIDVDAIVVRGVDTESLKKGPGHDPASSLPGQKGNCVIAAHRNAYGWWFYRLNGLGYGSLIELRTPRETFLYEVAWTRVVPDTATQLLDPPATVAAPRLTLYTCALPRGSKRIVVAANLLSRVPT